MDAANSRVLFNDGTNNRMYFGNNNGTIGMKLSQTGNNVLTASDDNLIWSSDFNTFKITQNGTINVTAFGASDNLWVGTVTHNLGYRPSVSVTVDITNLGLGYNFIPVPYTIIYFGAGLLPDQIPAQFNWYHIDTNRVAFRAQSYTGAFSQAVITFKYYLMRETSA